ncbi:cobalt-precorrin-6A reductase [cyanobacterium endosymbiont of Epithemia clementina EcSB]|uniref:cobalt-precorrin-6A reductase n=1 Tax=cyanobacterium endosymbiont of Epithemia clementina EcSB TaxID=3034674 RepID=UPI002481378B|nr:cobalt-precorrin-6A reductase [cyanobacterium endosymbiont of Epithemia clementina EcSB]WGT67560.1 cobalt-precorrin-6A reductase [cyanobacterium endosymbiont of Epithemia clementina EcSB]
MKKIWLIGGTRDSVTIAESIVSERLTCLVTVTTENAKTLYPISSYLTIKIGTLNPGQIRLLCQQEKIIAIVDASHPYAVQISRQVITVSKENCIPYLRYERVSLPPSPEIITLDNFDTLIKGNYLQGERTLLTIGYKALPLFKVWQGRAVLFARVLPKIESLEVAIKAGFSNDHLIALRPPISAELEQALWQQWNISLVVTKASGRQGGELIKRLVATELGVKIIIIKRPLVSYPQQTDKLSDIIRFCRQYFYILGMSKI